MSEEIKDVAVEKAKEEFKRLGWPGDDEMQKMLCDNIIELLKVFSSQDHSGSTAPYVLQLFNKLARHEAISPLTGEDDEWEDCGVSSFPIEGVWQNKRESSVFKEADGRAHWISGKLFHNGDHNYYTSGDSVVYIEFPWTKPEPEIVLVEKEKDLK